MFQHSPNTPAEGPDGPSRNVVSLNHRFRHHSATAVLTHALRDLGHVALVSSFGAESVALLHMTALIDRTAPVLFIDTDMLFTETLVYQQEVAERLGLNNIQVVRASASAVKSQDPEGILHRSEPDACCDLRKTRPLQSALEGFDGWITGRKRFQSGRRASLEHFEKDGGGIKINPLAHWRAEDVADYIAENRLPRHPLVARGYPSIGCAPCTSAVAKGEDARAGRWRNSDKDECGIHFVNGKLVRKGVNA